MRTPGGGFKCVRATTASLPAPAPTGGSFAQCATAVKPCWLMHALAKVGHGRASCAQRVNARDATARAGANQRRTCAAWGAWADRTGRTAAMIESLQLTGHEGFSFDCAWSPDGITLATASEDFTTRYGHGQGGVGCARTQA